MPRRRARSRAVAYPLAARIEQRLARNLARHPLAEDVELHGSPGRRLLRRQVRVRDRALDGVAVAAGGHTPGDLTVHPHRLVAERHRARVRERDAGEPPARLRVAERLAAEEVL